VAIRRVVTVRQRSAARLLLSGYSGVRALRAAGFGKSYARNLGRALARSWGLRQALREEAEVLGWQPRLRRERRHTYDKRRAARAITKIALPSEGETSRRTVTVPGAVPEGFAELRTRSGRAVSRCGNCGRATDELYADPSGWSQICRWCAGAA
jgi:hypothetical protein